MFSNVCLKSQPTHPCVPVHEAMHVVAMVPLSLGSALEDEPTELSCAYK